MGVRTLQFEAEIHNFEKSKKDRNFVHSGKSAYRAIINSEGLNHLAYYRLHVFHRCFNTCQLFTYRANT